MKIRKFYILPITIFFILAYKISEYEKNDIQKNPLKTAQKKECQTSTKRAKQLITLGDTYCNRGELARATAYYQQAIKKSRLSPQAHLHLGIALAMQGDLKRAVKVGANLREISPTYWRSFCTFGFLTYHQALAEKHQLKKSKNKAVLRAIMQKYLLAHR